MKRLRTQREYHDAQLISAEWLHERDLLLTFRLDGHWNDGMSGEAGVVFSGVRNRTDVEDALRSIAKAAGEPERLADVVAIVRASKGSFLVDTSQGPLVIDAAGLAEI